MSNLDDAVARLRDHAEYLDSEFPTGLDADGENDAARAIRIVLEALDECAHDHPPEPEYTAWCDAGMPDIRDLRANLEASEADAAVARLREFLVDPVVRIEPVRKAIRIVLEALEHAQDGASKYDAMLAANVSLKAKLEGGSK